MTIACPIALAAQTLPGHPAVVTSREVLSYADLDRMVSTAAGSLRQRGVGSADRIGVCLGSRSDLPIVLWALFRLRAVAVLLSDRDLEASMEGKIQTTGCRLVVSDKPINVSIPIVSPQILQRTDAAEIADRSRDLDLETQATIVFTSGSEARPKAVVHLLRNHWRSAEGSQSVIPVSNATRWGLVIPPHHIGGLSIFFRCFLGQGTVVVPDPNERTPSGISKYQVTHVSIVPTQLGDWLAGSDCAALSRLDVILVGGARTPMRLQSQARKLHLPVRISYGSTEMASQIATTDRDDIDSRPGYVGRVLPHRSVRIEHGEILVRGETLFAGYWRDESLVTSDGNEGWFATGDMGELVGDRLIVTGRRDNRFISGGENIHPEEIEEAIVSAGLADVAIVVPIAHERFGERPVAFVRPFTSSLAVTRGLRKILPGFKIPDRVLPLPDHMDGSKQDRRHLADEAAQPPSG